MSPETNTPRKGLSGRDKAGIIVLVALFVLLCATAYYVLAGSPGASSRNVWSENIFVRQRVININK
jgi:hypothetical protein